MCRPSGWSFRLSSRRSAKPQKSWRWAASASSPSGPSSSPSSSASSRTNTSWHWRSSPAAITAKGAICSEWSRPRWRRSCEPGHKVARARKPRILVLHGPNLNLLGEREPQHYGRATLAEIDRELAARAGRAGATIECFQSNIEGELVTRIQHARGQFDAIVINPAAYTHTSVAIRDALVAVALPAVEVHLSNLYRRAQEEPFRARSMVAAACAGTIAGFGAESYYLGLEAALRLIAKDTHA